MERPKHKTIVCETKISKLHASSCILQHLCIAYYIYKTFFYFQVTLLDPLCIIRPFWAFMWQPCWHWCASLPTPTVNIKNTWRGWSMHAFWGGREHRNNKSEPCLIKRPSDAIWWHRTGSTLALRQQAITSISVDLSSVRCHRIHLRVWSLKSDIAKSLLIHFSHWY